MRTDTKSEGEKSSKKEQDGAEMMEKGRTTTEATTTNKDLQGDLCATFGGGFTGIPDATTKHCGSEETSITYPTVEDSSRSEEQEGNKGTNKKPSVRKPTESKKILSASEVEMAHPTLDNLIEKKLPNDERSGGKWVYFPDQSAVVKRGRKVIGEKVKCFDEVRKKKTNNKSQKLAYFPDQPASSRARRGGKEENLKNGKANTALAIAPPSLYIEEEDIEVATEQNNWPKETYPGANRVRGIDWSGNDDDDNYTENATISDETNESTNAYLVEAHKVHDPVLVEAKPDSFFRRNQWWIVGGCLALVIMIITAVTFSSVDLSGPEGPTEAPTTIQEGIEAKVKELIIAQIPDSEASLSETKMPQYQALQWIVNEIDSNGWSWYNDERILRQYSLAVLYLSTSSDSDDEESLSFWNDSRKWMEIVNECEWYGISCDDDNNIVGLNLPGNNLRGVIPADIGLLSTLLTLNLSGNTLSGSLPNEMFKLTDLSTLNLAQNYFLKGSIPSLVGQMTDLSLLDLSENQLESTIPSEIGEVSALTTLKLFSNNMIGSLPSEIGDLVILEELNLHDNSLTHKLPTEIGKLVKVTNLHLQNNDLLGPLPSEIGLMRSLRNWNMSNNHVFGDLPKSLWQGNSLQNIEALDFSHNLLSTRLSQPHEFRDFGLSWNKLTSLRLGNNFLQEYELPLFIIKNLQNLQEFDISSNYFDGKLPNGLFDMTQLKILNLGKSGMFFDPEYDEQIDSTLSINAFQNLTSNLLSLEQLDLSYCNIHGSIPTEIEMLNQLTSVALNSNYLTGTIPTEIGNLNQLTSVGLDFNLLSGTIPTEMGNLVELKEFHVHQRCLSRQGDGCCTHWLTGKLPTEIGNLVDLEVFDLHSNCITGTLPTEIGNAVSLDELDFGYNLLSGTLPSEIGNVIDLEIIDLESNALTGKVPTEIGNLVALEKLNLSLNKYGGLTGPIPTEIGNLASLEELRLNAIPYIVFRSISRYLASTIPTEIGRLASLKIMNVAYNDLTGVVPTEISELVQLEYLDLSNNYLTGSIPFSFCEMDRTPSIGVDCMEVICHCCRCPQYTPPSSSPLPSVSPTLSQTPTITASPTREHPCPPVPVGGCSICGEGKCVRNADAVFEFPPTIPSVPCGVLEMGGLFGGMEPDLCALLPSLVELSVCECDT